ncbi:MAG: peptidoglycan domain protein [Bacteroidales bacterium]|nr:peptidoglycan domain protein [Bacteroidales bacterium]
MARIESIVPFILKWETGTTGIGLTNEQLFEKAKLKGFANDPDDLGGATMCGVTLATFTEYCRRKGYPRPTIVRLKAITYKEWLEILKTMFWDKWKADQINNESIALILVDWVWGSGKYGITIPQKAIGVTADGIVGPKTIAAVNAKDPKQLFDLIRKERLAYIERICRSRPTNLKYKRGWLNRLNDIKFKGV